MHLYARSELFSCDHLFADRETLTLRSWAANKDSVLRSRCHQPISVVQPDAINAVATMHRSLSEASKLPDRLAFHTLPALLFFLTFIASAAPAYAQISPGPLAKAHQSLSGVLSCTKCHDMGAGGVKFKCLDCHTEIRDRLAQNRGMHALWVGTKGTSKDCVQCHSDHNGADFPLVRWQPNREALDHRQTGFPLTGGHAGLRCEQCHNAREVQPAARAGIQVKDLNHTYLGLTSACAGATRMSIEDNWARIVHSATPRMPGSPPLAIQSCDCEIPADRGTRDGSLREMPHHGSGRQTLHQIHGPLLRELHRAAIPILIRAASKEPASLAITLGTGLRWLN